MLTLSGGFGNIGVYEIEQKIGFTMRSGESLVQIVNRLERKAA